MEKVNFYCLVTFFFLVYNGVEDRTQDLLHKTQTPHHYTKPSGLLFGNFITNRIRKGKRKNRMAHESRRWHV
jgi:hypothetical protein